MRYPVGHPTIINYDFKDLDEYFGLIKCKVLPPANLYIPVLPVHVGNPKKLVFPLCRTCAEEQQCNVCTHREGRRALVGTWHTEEMKLAVKKGYKILKIFTIWHFEETSDQLFAEYVKTFYKQKLMSSKLPFQDEDQILEYMEEVEKKEKIKIDKVTDFKENPGLRQLTKLMLNNLWGRFGMQENKSKSVFISSFEKLLHLINDESIEVQGVRIVSKTVVQVIYRTKSSDFLEMIR
jgi:hypothetical protein